ncbi:hypothetical protein QEH52_14205 [Coraliomargarita sp. SDUM461003]|uniref:PEP-CTERM protein-sorting domain-containing protein n=1 Tax=Thalassobacterium maritimum TaxID=3041265 RepID=A0ABU1AX00_9BACT|nr:hypothetical protein [Coraliomargarita sp. SDUM461003]MDQ8208675.1 hypothetical protein [Coraliomargarita sp. SDUM461003]
MKAITYPLTLIFAVSHAGAATIAQYNFNSGSTPYADVANASGLSAGDIVLGDQMDSAPNITTNYSSEGAGSLFVAGSAANAGSGSTSTAWGNANTNGLYFEFTLTPDAGQTLNLTNLELDVAAKGTDAFRLGVTSSLTGFDYADRLTITTESSSDADSIPNVLQSNLDGIKLLTDTGVDEDWGAGEGTIIDLSSSTFDNISAPVTFRIYGFQLNNNTSTNAIFFDDIQVNGTVIPEASSFALLAGFCTMGLVMVRRRR